MEIVLIPGSSNSAVKIICVAGQFAKPYSPNTEKREGVELSAYRGGVINGVKFVEDPRISDPRRTSVAYSQLIAFNLLRAFLQEGYDNFGYIHTWMLDFVSDSSQGGHCKQLGRQIYEMIAFVFFTKITTKEDSSLREISFCTNYEGLLLGHKEALMRIVSIPGG
ncbi:3-deoxy-7-phosphoheptulonate synthase [Bartonella sp. CB178]|uniref:3-deoxy-7-phosphoheptulonate synthase n=1 Tax=Bartonella sp. CB178 TaxID=3112255 RepID=UPI00300E41D8